MLREVIPVVRKSLVLLERTFTNYFFPKTNLTGGKKLKICFRVGWDNLECWTCYHYWHFSVKLWGSCEGLQSHTEQYMYRKLWRQLRTEIFHATEFGVGKEPTWLENIKWVDHWASTAKLPFLKNVIPFVSYAGTNYALWPNFQCLFSKVTCTRTKDLSHVALQNV